MQITTLPPFSVRLEYTVELTPHYMAGREQFFLQRLQKQSVPEKIGCIAVPNALQGTVDNLEQKTLILTI